MRCNQLSPGRIQTILKLKITDLILIGTLATRSGRLRKDLQSRSMIPLVKSTRLTLRVEKSLKPSVVTKSRKHFIKLLPCPKINPHEWIKVKWETPNEKRTNYMDWIKANWETPNGKTRISTPQRSITISRLASQVNGSKTCPDRTCANKCLRQLWLITNCQKTKKVILTRWRLKKV